MKAALAASIDDDFFSVHIKSYNPNTSNQPVSFQQAPPSFKPWRCNSCHFHNRPSQHNALRLFQLTSPGCCGKCGLHQTLTQHWKAPSAFSLSALDDSFPPSPSSSSSPSSPPSASSSKPSSSCCAPVSVCHANVKPMCLSVPESQAALLIRTLTTVWPRAPPSLLPVIAGYCFRDNKAQQQQQLLLHLPSLKATDEDELVLHELLTFHDS